MAIPEDVPVAEDGDQSAPPGWVEPTAFDYTAMSEAQAGSTWDGNARVYQWSDEYGDVGPAFEELEIDLFGSLEDRNKHHGGGLDFSKFVSQLHTYYNHANLRGGKDRRHRGHPGRSPEN